MSGTNWTCPYCNRPQTITDGQAHYSHEHIYLKNHRYGEVGLDVSAIACSNPECGEVTVHAVFAKDEWARRSGDTASEWRTVERLQSYQLRPEGAAKPQPSYIPEPIREDYVEACRILNASPKASATLSRRCLQGMIRDFCGISKNRLIDEIGALDEAVAEGKGPIGVLPDSVEAIDHVRGVGNIGAHMEKDVNVVIPVKPFEAKALIDLIELLFEEWYVARHLRQQKLERVKAIATSKEALKQISGPSLEKSEQPAN